jgi:hypothetical protein
MPNVVILANDPQLAFVVALQILMCSLSLSLRKWRVIIAIVGVSPLLR